MVVPTRDRPERLAALLRSLAAQRLPRHELEVIVVDDGSQGGPPGPVEGPPVRVLRHASPRGPAAARNTGWRAARAPAIAFTDDDCEAAPGWLAALVSVLGGDEATIVQGRTEPHPAERARLTPLSRTQTVAGPDSLFETCNIAYPRALLERVGGFDESFRHPCGEDVDLGWRARKAGAQVEFAPEALVYHAVHEPGVWAAARQTLRWTDAVRVVKAHPETRRRLVAGCFWKPTHPRLLAALAGALYAARTRRPAAAVAASLPYLAHHRRAYAGARRPWAAAARRLPAHLAIDLCEVATMAAGSLRHRTLML